MHGKLSQSPLGELKNMTALEFPHWLMIAGVLLLLLGLVGFAVRQRSVQAEPTPFSSDDELLGPEEDLTPAEIYRRTAKEKRKARWADGPPEELEDADPKT
jgi:hypothetical protein